MNEEKDKTITDPEEVGREGRAQRQTANTTPEPVAAATANVTEKPGKYAFLYEQEAEKPMSESDLEKMAQREKRNMRFAKISDALRALAGTSGKKPSMVQTVNDRYNLMRDKDREARLRYLTGKMNAMRADDSEAMAQKTFDFQLAKYKDEQKQQAKLDRERAEDKKKEEERWNKTFEENKRQADRSHDFRMKQHNDNVGLHREANEAGKEFIAYDSEGNPHRFSKQEAAEVYARQQGTWEDDVTEKKVVREVPDETTGETTTTTTTTTQVTGGRSVKRDNTTGSGRKDDDVVDYTPGGGDEVIDYVPGKK